MKLSVAAYRAIADTANKRLTRGWQRRRSTYGSIGDSPQQQEQELVNTVGGHQQTSSSSSSSCSTFNHDDEDDDRDHVRRPTRSDTTFESQRRPEEVATQSTDDEDDEVCPADTADTSPRHPLPSHGSSLAASALPTTTATTTTPPLTRGTDVATTAASAKTAPPPTPDVKSLSAPPPPTIPPPSVNRPTSTVNRFLPSRSRGTQRWMKLRTTVQLTGAVTSAVREKKPPLKREDSFLKRFSTRQTADFSDDDYDGPASDYYSSGQSGGGHWGGKGGGGGRGMKGVGGEGGPPGFCGRTMSVDHRIALHRRRRKHARRMRSTVINPDENFYFWWLTVITACVLYNCWTLIVRQAFPELQQSVAILWNSLDATCDLLLVADVAVQFRTGYLEQGLIVYDSRKLAAHYVRSRPFLLDVLTMFPLDLLRVWIERPAPLLRFPRFIKVYRSCMYFRIVESRTLYPNVWRVVNLVHILLLLAHWFGCFYYLLSEAEGFVGDWVYPKPTGDYGTLTRKYLGSLYWSTLTLTTIGDLATPETNWQYLFTIVSYLIGVFIFATIVGQVGNVITNRNANRLEFERLLDGAKLYMRHHKVPRDMQRRVQRWYDYTWSRGRMHAGGDINTALGILPDKLKTELALHVNLTTLKKVTIFQECQPEFLHDLVLKMKAFIFTPGDLICRKGEVAREMFIIADGILEVISETGKVLTTMKAGDFFGEIGILNLDGLNRRTADVRSVGYAELFSLSREDVLSAMKDYPEAQEILQTMGKKRLMEARKAAVFAKKELTAAATAASAMAASEATCGSPEGPAAAATGSTPGGAGVQTGPDSDSARQKAVLMVRRLRRDAKDLRNYLMKGSTKRGSSLFRSKDEEAACVGKADDVRIEMETVQTRPASERRMTRDRLKSSSSQEDPPDEADPSDKTRVRGGSQQEAGRVTSSFLQRVLALRHDKSPKEVDSETQHAASGCGGGGDVTDVAPSKPSVSFVGDDGTTTKRPADANTNRGGQLWKTVKDSMLTSKGRSGFIQETDEENLADTSATSIQAWSATFHPHDPRIQTLTSNSLGFSTAPPSDDEARRTATAVNESQPPSTMTESRTPTASETHLSPLPLIAPPRVKSILKHHLSRSESDVSGLLFSMVPQKQTTAAVKKARLAKTVSFRDQVKALQSSTGQVESTFGQDECVADLLIGIKQVLQIRMDEVQSQFKSRLVALEVAMQEKEGHIHQLQTKLFEMEVREEANRCYESVTDGRTGTAAAAAWTSSPQNALTSLDEDPTYLTHPGYVCHPRRSWPMLASRQRRVVSYHRHSSVDELLQLEHHYRTRCPSLREVCSAATRTSDSEGEPTSDLMISPDDDPEDEEEEDDEEDDYEDTEDLRMEQSDSESENTVAWIDGHSIADDGFVVDNNDWEIQMLAQEMIKQEAKTKDLPDVVEEEDDDDDEYEYGMCLSSSSRRATVGETSMTTPLPYRRRLSRKLRRQQSWAGEPERLLHDSSTTSSSAAATAMPPPLPRRLESMPVVEDNKIIEQFVHSTLRRLDKLEKVFTGVSEPTQPPPKPPLVVAAVASGRRKPLSTLRAQRSLDLQLEDRVVDESPQQRRHRTLNRYASFGDGLSSNQPPTSTPPSPSLSQLNIPVSSIRMTASIGSPSSSSQPQQQQQQQPPQHHPQSIITSPTYNRNRPTTVAALQQLEEPSGHAAVGLPQYRNVRGESIREGSLPRELDNNGTTRCPPSSSAEDVDEDRRPLLAPSLTSPATMSDPRK